MKKFNSYVIVTNEVVSMKKIHQLRVSGHQVEQL